MTQRGWAEHCFSYIILRHAEERAARLEARTRSPQPWEVAIINAYDEIAYPPGVFRQSHPDRLAAHARLFGLNPAPPEHCRVLEIGASDGSNLIPIALTHPGAQCLGFDLAEAPVRRGNLDIETLGLANARLIQGDIRTIDLEPGSFDYIIAQGVYCSIPAEVRAALMPLIRRLLAPQGVAYVSYNTLPGGYVRLAIRHQLLFATRHIADRTERMRAAMRLLAEWPPPGEELGPSQLAVAQEAARMSELPLGAVTHDELNDDYLAIHLSDFGDHCAASGLKIMSEASTSEIGDWLAPPGQADGFDPVAAAQRADHEDARFFRQSLIVRDDAPIDRAASLGRLAGLHVSSRATRAEGGGFVHPGASDFELNDGSLSVALERLGAIWPATAPVAEAVPDPQRRLALLSLCAIGALELHAAPSTFPILAGDRPTASPLARLQASRGETRLTTLRNSQIGIEDDFSRSFLASLDGTRTRARIAADLAPRMGLTPEAALAPLAALLDGLGRAALLVA